MAAPDARLSIRALPEDVGPVTLGLPLAVLMVDSVATVPDAVGEVTDGLPDAVSAALAAVPEAVGPVALGVPLAVNSPTGV